MRVRHRRADVLPRRSGLRAGLLSSIVLPLLALVGACSIGPQAREPPTSYDLGPQRNHAPESTRIRAVLLIPGISAPAWLDNTGIVYRLRYQDPARALTYANSRWAASPASLLAQRVRSRFAATASGIITSGDGARADYALRMELEDFSQSFDALNQSRVSVKARATLINLGNRTLVAQRTFAVERPAIPNAGGAVTALSESSDAMIEDLLDWVEQNLRIALAGPGG